MEKARVTAISRLKSRRGCCIWWLVSRIGRGGGEEASICGGETSIPFHPATGMPEEEEEKKKHRREKEEGADFFPIPRRLFRILIKERVRDKGRLAISRLESTKFRGMKAGK